MKLALGQTTEAVVDPVGEDREDIKLPHLFLLKTYRIYSSLRRAINLGTGDKWCARSNSVTEEEGSVNYKCRRLSLEVIEKEL
jgi:hypothetical protein